MLCLKL